METLMMSGRPVADEYKEQIKEKVEEARVTGKQVTLAIVTVGEDPASFVYRKRLLKMRTLQKKSLLLRKSLK